MKSPVMPAAHMGPCSCPGHSASSQLPADGLKKAEGPSVWAATTHIKRPRWSSWFLALALPILSHCSPLGSKLGNGKLSLFSAPPHWLPNKHNSLKIIKKILILLTLLLNDFFILAFLPQYSDILTFSQEPLQFFKNIFLRILFIFKNILRIKCNSWP